MLADEQRLHMPGGPGWHCIAMAPPLLLREICDALYERSQQAPLTRVELMFPSWVPGTGLVP